MDLPQENGIDIPPTDEVDGGPHVEEVHQNAMVSEPFYNFTPRYKQQKGKLNSWCISVCPSMI